MESKLNALLIIVMFVVMSLVGLIMRFALHVDFDVKIYFWYLILLCGFLFVFGRPIVLLALDLIKAPYRENEGNFPLPGDNLSPNPKKENKEQPS